jgi:hypothetical protein
MSEINNQVNALIQEQEKLRASIRDLKKKDDEISSQIANLCAELKIGQRVWDYGRHLVEITGVSLVYRTTVRYSGRRVLKSGALHKIETIVCMPKLEQNK